MDTAQDIRARLSDLFAAGRSESEWYVRNSEVIEQHANAMGVDVKTFTLVVAATSQRNRWNNKNGRLNNIESAERAIRTAREHPGIAPEVLASKPNPGMLRCALEAGIRCYR